MRYGHICPVCSYPDLDEAPRSASGGASDECCPSCGFQFGWTDDDQGITYEDWRGRWKLQGRPWISQGIVKPTWWKPEIGDAFPAAGKGRMRLPVLYALLDAGLLATRSVPLFDASDALLQAGVQLVQYRDKLGSPQEVLRGSAVLKKLFSESQHTLIMNDRADLAVLAGFDGVHVGQGDLSPEYARSVVGARRIVGVSTHTEQQVVAANPTSQNRDPSAGSGHAMGHPGVVDYIAIGPVFATGTKADAEAVVGLEGVRRARALTAKPLVAIGGITRANARSVIDAGADSVAVISGLFAPGESVEKVARDFLEILGRPSKDQS